MVCDSGLQMASGELSSSSIAFLSVKHSAQIVVSAS